MSQSDLFREITQTYQKFGWKLRGVLLDDEAARELVESKRLIPENVSVEKRDVNALWFSRDSGGRETWELRLLSASPFALLETFEPSIPESEREKRLTRMAEKLQMNRPKLKV